MTDNLETESEDLEEEWKYEEATDSAIAELIRDLFAREHAGESLDMYRQNPAIELYGEVLAWLLHAVPEKIACSEAPSKTIYVYGYLQQPPKGAPLFRDPEVSLLTKVCRITPASTKSLLNLLWHFTPEERRRFFPLDKWAKDFLKAKMGERYANAYLRGFVSGRESQARDFRDICEVTQSLMTAMADGQDLNRADITKLNDHLNLRTLLEVSDEQVGGIVPLEALSQGTYIGGPYIISKIASEMMSVLLRERIVRARDNSTSVLRCQVCGNIFFRFTQKQIYCTDQCANRARARRFREKGKITLSPVDEPL